MESLKEYGFPIMGEVDFGHETVNIPMLIGVEVALRAGRRQLEFLESGVE